MQPYIGSVVINTPIGVFVCLGAKVVAKQANDAAAVRYELILLVINGAEEYSGLWTEDRKVLDVYLTGISNALSRGDRSVDLVPHE